MFGFVSQHRLRNIENKIEDMESKIEFLKKENEKLKKVESEVAMLEFQLNGEPIEEKELSQILEKIVEEHTKVRLIILNPYYKKYFIRQRGYFQKIVRNEINLKVFHPEYYFNTKKVNGTTVRFFEKPTKKHFVVDTGQIIR